MRKALALLVVSISLLAGVGFFGADAHATTAGFNPGEIVDDSVMRNAGSMSVSDIQRFLNSKVPNCDTNGTQASEFGGGTRAQWAAAHGYKPPFTCLKDYSEGGKASSQIIYNVSNKYSINPQVLIVLLQKEQGLVTDTWPLSVQYKTATGYGCPDTAPCDSQYYGLTNQLDWAAKMYNSIITQNPNWYSPYFKGTNPTVYWNPDTSRCGSKGLDIQNWSTASLYSYTPYRPNQAALNAGYGTGDSCSSYGNRNFYSYFTDWFGSTTTPLFQIKNTNATVYFSFGDTYYPISSPSILRAYGLSGKRIVQVSSSQLSSYSQGPALSRVVKYGSNSTVYLVDNGTAYPVPSWSMLNNYGYGSGDLTTYSDTNLLNALDGGNSISQLARRPSGAIYYVASGNLHVFPDATTLNSEAPGLTGSSSLSYSTYSDDLLNGVVESSPVLMQGVTASANDTAAIFLYDNGKLMIFSPTTWKQWGQNLNYNFPEYSKLKQLGLGSGVPLLVSSNGTAYFVSNGKKYPVSSSAQTTLGLSSSAFTDLSTRATNTLQTSNSVGSLLRTPDGAVYSVISGKKYPVPTITDFNNLNYKWSDVVTVDSSIIDTISSGSSYLFAPNSLIRTPDGAVYLIDSGFKAHVIPSITSFNAYGFSWKNVRNYDSSALSAYTKDTLEALTQTSTGGGYKLADSGNILSVSASAYGASQYAFGSRSRTTISPELSSALGSAGTLTYYAQGSGTTVYKIVSGSKRAFTSASKFYADGGSWSSVTKLSDYFLQQVPNGSPI